MKDSIIETIDNLIAHIRTQPGTREASLVITKLQEARMWQEENQKVIKAKAEQVGVGIR